MAVGDAYVFPGFLTPVLTLLFFPKPPTTFLTCFCRGERRKYAGKKSRLNQGSNSQPPGHESDTLTTEPPGRGLCSRQHSLIQDHVKHCDKSMNYFSNSSSVFCTIDFKPWSRRANGRVRDKKSFYPFISVLYSFLIRWIRSLSGDVRWCPFQNFPPYKRTETPVWCTLLCGSYAYKSIDRVSSVRGDEFCHRITKFCVFCPFFPP